MRLRFFSITIKIIFLFLLTNQLALAGLPLPQGFPTNLTRQDLGEFVGSGAFKTVSKVKGFEGYVVAYFTNASKPNQEPLLQKEVSFLDELQAKGIRTVDNYGMVQVEGRPAYVMRYIPDALLVSVYDSYFNEVPMDYQIEALNRFNQNSLDDINLLYKALQKYQNLSIGDLQFLLVNDGHLYLNDPMKLSVGRGESTRVIKILSSIIFEKLYRDPLPFHLDRPRFLKTMDYKTTPLGTFTEKTVHKLNSYPNYVVVIPKDSTVKIQSLQSVLDLLDEAKSYGVNTVKHYGLVAVETLEGIKPGIVMENIKYGIKVTDYRDLENNTEALSRVNRHTLEDLHNIEQALRGHDNFGMKYQQFLLKEDGHLVLIDPAVIEPRNLPMMNEYKELLQQQINEIKRVTQEQITLRESPGAELQTPKKVIFVWIGGKLKVYQGDRIKPAIWAEIDANIPVELYYDPENMLAGFLKKMIKIKATTPPYSLEYFSDKQMQFEMIFADYVKRYGLSDTTRLRFMREILRVDPERLENKSKAISKYWREDFAVENPKVKLLNLQELFVSEDNKAVQLKEIYERELTYRGGDLAAASDVIKSLVLDKKGGLCINNDISLETPTRESLNETFAIMSERDPVEYKELSQLTISTMIDEHKQLMSDPFRLLNYERQMDNPNRFSPYQGENQRQKIVFTYNLSLQEKRTLVEALRTELQQNGFERLGYLKVINSDRQHQQVVFSNEDRYPIVNRNTEGIDVYVFDGGNRFEEELRLFHRVDLRDYSDVTLTRKSLTQLSTEIHDILYPEVQIEVSSCCKSFSCGLLGKERGEYVREIEEDLSSGKVTYKELTSYQRLLTDKYITEVPKSVKEVFENENNLNTFELEKDMKKQFKANEELVSLVKEWRNKSVEFLKSQGLDPKNWIPLTKNTRQLEDGTYQIEYINKSGIEEEIRRFEVSDDIHLRLKLKIDEITEFGTSLQSLEDGATSRGVGQVGMGLAIGIQALLHSTNEHWWGNKDLQGIYFNAIRAQIVVNLTQAVLSVPMTAIEVVSIYKELIGSMIPRTFSRVFAVEGAVNVGFAIANLVLDSIQLSESTTAQQRAYSGVMVGFDSAALGLGIAALGLGIVGASAAATVTGGLALPIAAIGFGTAILAQGYQARLDQAEKVADFFTERRDEYFSADIVDFNDSNHSDTYQYVNATVPVKSIDFISGVIRLGAFYVYDSKNYDQGPLGVHECAYYNRYDTAHRTAQQKQDDAISAIDVWKKYSQGMSTKYTDPTPVNEIRLRAKIFNPDLSSTFVLPSIAPYYVAYNYGLISFSSVDHALKYIRPFNEFGADYNPGDSVDQGWNNIELVKSLKSHDMYIILDDVNKTLVQPKPYPLSEGVLNYKIFGPSSEVNNKKRIDIISNASQGGKNNHFFLYSGRNQDFVISGMKGLPEYKGVVYSDVRTRIGTIDESVSSNVGHLHFKVGDDNIYISTIPYITNSINTDIYFVSDGIIYKIVGDSFEVLSDDVNIESFHGDMLKIKPFLEQHTLFDSISHLGSLIKLKDADGEYRVQTWFYHKNNIFLYPQISRDNKNNDIELLKFVQDKNNTRAYFIDHTSKKIFSNIVDTNATQFVEYSEATKEHYFQNSNSGDITDAFLSFTDTLMAYTEDGYLYSLVKDQNGSKVYAIVGLNYDAYINSAKVFSDLKSSIHTIVEAFKEDNITILTPNFIEITREFKEGEASKSYWYDVDKDKFAYKDGAYKQHKNGNIMVEMLDHYGLVYDGASKRMYATPIVSYADFTSQSDTTFAEKEIFTNERYCLDNFKYQGDGVFYALTCSHQKIFRAENAIGQYRRYQADKNAMFEDNISVTSNTVALYSSFMIPAGQNALEYMKRLIDNGEISLDSNTEYLPWFKGRDEEKFTFYVVPDKDGSFQYGAQFYVGLQSNGLLGKYADRRYRYIGYDKSAYRGYLFKEDTKELLEIYDLYDIKSRQLLQSVQSYQSSTLFELIDKNSTNESEFVVPYMDNKKLVTILAKNESKVTIKEGLKEYSLSTYINIDLSEINSSSASNSIEIDFAFGDEIALRDSYLGKELVIKENNDTKGSIFLSGFQLSSEVQESDKSTPPILIRVKLKDDITKEIHGYLQSTRSNLSSNYNQLQEDSLKYRLKDEIGYTIVSNKMNIATDDTLNDLQLEDSDNNILYSSSNIKMVGKDYVIELKYKDSSRPNAYIYLEHNRTTSYHINILGDNDNIIKHIKKLKYKINSEESYNTIELILEGTPNKNYPVCFYTNSNYQGDKSCVRYNTYTPYLFTPFDNNISSIKFAEGISSLYLRVYTGEDFTKDTTRYSTSQPTLNSPFNANISSFVVSDSNTTRLPFGTKELNEPNVYYPVCLYGDSNATKICYRRGHHLIDNAHRSFKRVSVYGDWQGKLSRDEVNAPYITVKRLDPLVLSNKLFIDASLERLFFENTPLNSVNIGMELPSNIDKIKLTYNSNSLEVIPVKQGDDYFIQIDNFNGSNKMLELYFRKELFNYSIQFYGSKDVLDTINMLKIEYIKSNTNYYIGTLLEKKSVFNHLHVDTLEIATQAFGGGCITNVRGYAQKKSCNPLNKNQFLNYTSNHKLKNPWSDECLTVLSNNNPPKVAYTQCQDNNQTQTFSYNSTTKQFIYPASNQCLDVHGGNKRDIILWSCHNGTNQKFALQHISQNIDEYNITNETPLVSKEYSTQVDHGTVYFITPTQQKAHGVTKRVWYKKGISEIEVLALDDKHRYHVVKLSAQRSTRDCGSFTMNSGVMCETGSFSSLKVAFDRLANPQLPIGRYKGSFTLLAKGWHDTSYTQPIQINIDLNLTNIAFHKPTQQSSNYYHSYNPTSSKAVDSNIDGDFNAKTTTHTNRDKHAWWQVDLQAYYAIDQIKIYNRTDCCSNRLNNAKVFISETPFGNDSLQAAQAKAKWSGDITQAQPINTLDVDSTTGRYIRVQLEDTNYLSLTEVKVFGKIGTNTLHSTGVPSEFTSVTVRKTNRDQTINNLKKLSALWAADKSISSEVEVSRVLSSGDNIWFNFYEYNRQYNQRIIKGARIRITEEEHAFKLQQTDAKYKLLTQEEYDNLVKQSGGRLNPYLVDLENNNTGSAIMGSITRGYAVDGISLEFLNVTP